MHRTRHEVETLMLMSFLCNMSKRHYCSLYLNDRSAAASVPLDKSVTPTPIHDMRTSVVLNHPSAFASVFGRLTEDKLRRSAIMQRR